MSESYGNCLILNIKYTKLKVSNSKLKLYHLTTCIAPEVQSGRMKLMNFDASLKSD